MDKIFTDYALALPSTFMTEQWGGAHVFKVGDAKTFKMFAILRPESQRLTVKALSAETCEMLIEVGVAERHSHLPRGNWIVLHTDKIEADDVKSRISDSYETVLAALPKRMQAFIAKA